MLVTIDLDALILRAAVHQMDNPYHHECVAIVAALQKQMPEELNIKKRLRQQVKEYKKLTMWKD
jgi:hypothetical protein